MVKYYAAFLYPGIIVAEESTKEISGETIDPKDIPEGCEAFKTFQIREEIIDGITMKSGRLKETPWTYIGRKLTAAEAIAEAKDNSIAVSNIRCNKYEYLVKTRRGSMYPIESDTKVMAG